MRLRFFLACVLSLAPAFAAAQEAVPLAKIIKVEDAGNAMTRTFFGQVVAKETVDLAFQVGGQIVEFPVIEGEPVAKDAVIARLDLEPFELALDQAKAQQAQAQRTLERLEKLSGNTVSQVTVDDARTQMELADISVRNTERSLEQATLKSPFDALVAARSIAAFSTIGAGTPVVRLHDVSELRMEIDVPEVLFQSAGENPDVEIWAQFPTSDTRYPLLPREFNAETSAVGQTFRITLGMAAPEGLVVLPGSSVTVTAVLKGGTPITVIPLSSVITENDGSASVMVFAPTGAEEGRVTRTPIEIAPTQDGTVRVVSGLDAGQEIVATGASALGDGADVRRFTGFSN